MTKLSDRRRPLLAALGALVGVVALGALIGIGATSPGPAIAAPVLVEGKRFDDSLRLFDSDLVLNGTGVRQVAWLKGYAAGLYLGAAAKTAAAVAATPGPKRLRMHMLQEVAAAEFSKAVHKGVGRNTGAAEQPVLRDRLAVFERQVDSLGKVRKGDIVDLDFGPAQGTSLVVNGKRVGEPIAGDDFYAALLRSFVGDQPYDEALKAGLLGRRKAAADRGAPS